MSPPITSSVPAYQTPHKDSASSGSANFPDSLFGDGGFVCDNMGQEIPKFSGRVKPRLSKMRKKKLSSSQNGKLEGSCSGFNQTNEAFSDISGQATSNYVGFVFGGHKYCNTGRRTGLENGECSESSNATGKFCKMGIVFGADKTNLASNLDVHDGDYMFGENINSSMSTIALNNGHFLFGSTKDSSMLNPVTGKTGFVFAANKTGTELNTNLENDVFAFGVNKSNLGVNSNFKEKESSVNGGLSGADEFNRSDNLEFVFGADKYEPAKIKQNGSNDSGSQSSINGFGEVNNASFVFCAGKTASASNGLDPKKKDFSRNARRNRSSKDIGETAFDIMGKAQATEESKKVFHSSFAFPSKLNVNSTEEHFSFVFGADGNNPKSGADLEINSLSKNDGKWDFTDNAKDNRDIGNEFQKTDVNSSFGERGDEKILNPDGTNLPVDENFNNFVGLKYNAGKDYDSELIFGSSYGLVSDFQKSPVFEISDKIKGLKIDGSEDDAEKSRIFSGNSSTNCNVFVFGRNRRNPGFSHETPDTTFQDSSRDASITVEDIDLEKGDGDDAKRDVDEVHTHENTGKTADFGRQNVTEISSSEEKNMNSTSGAEVSSQHEHSWFFTAGFGKGNDPIDLNKKASDESKMPQNDIESNSKSSSSFFSSIGTAQKENVIFCEVPSISKVEKKDDNSFTSTLPRFDSSSAFTFSASNLFPGINNKFEFSANCKSVRSRRMKKANGKLRQRSSVQQLSEQNCMSEEGCFQQTQGCGSPMDFSPCQDASSNAPSSGFVTMDTGVEREDTKANGKDFTDHVERPSHDKSNFSFSTPLPVHDGLSAIRHQYKKKYKLKVGSNHTTPHIKSSNASPCTVQSSSAARNASNLGQVMVESRETSFFPSEDKYITAADKIAKQGPQEADDVCEHWRIRGNEAYHAGKLSKAEEFYSKGINSVPGESVQGCSIKPLLLCYSNRAATRMSLGRLREALEDCTKAIALEPGFLKVTLRAGNCHLVLGEVEDAMQCYKRCLESGSDVCLDRRLTVEAADGLQKAQRVAEFVGQSAKLLLAKTHEAASNALRNIDEALMISRYSERLLEMKGEALCLLQRYDEVIQLFEQTLDISEKNLVFVNMDDSNWNSTYVRLWRWRLQSKSHYHMGRLDTALDFIEKQEELISRDIKSRHITHEPVIPFAATVRELLRLKKLGNEAFQSGRYAEAVEHYTAGISKSGEARHFMAICFCNRAAAYQALGQIIDAISDCSVAIALDENYQKAVSRRATLHEMIRDYKQATSDLQRLIFLCESQLKAKNLQSGVKEKSSCGSVKDLRRTRRHLSFVEDKAKTEIPLDLYLILGIKASDTESEIRKAYRRAALRHHPDKAGQLLARNDDRDDGRLWKEVVENVHKDADRLFKIIGEAYAVVSDPIKRSTYDNEEEVRNYYRDSNSEKPSTSYSSYDRGSRYGRQSGYHSSSSERGNNRRYSNGTWKSDGNSHSQW